MVYVLSDIHGNERRFNSILEQINLQSDDILYILGDVVDRHPEGIRILRKIMKMPNVKMLLGNHEYMMLNALGCPYDAADDTNELLQRKALRLWYSNGGKVTHDSLKHLRKTQRLEIVEFLRALPLNLDVTVNGTQYKLVHGAPVEDFDNATYDNPTQFAVWERRYRYPQRVKNNGGEPTVHGVCRIDGGQHMGAAFRLRKDASPFCLIKTAAGRSVVV